MKKFCFSFFLLLVCATCLQAQNKQQEAIANYRSAEEAFSTANYNEALNQLQQAKTNLGAANSKILYLQIMIERELAKTDKAYFDKAMASIKSFEKAPDIKTFNKEKYLEVMKLKSTLQEERTQAEKLDRAFKEFTFQDWPIGVPLENVKEVKANSALWSKTKTYNLGDTMRVLGSNDYTYMLSSNTISGIVMNKANTVYGYNVSLRFISHSISAESDDDYGKFLKECSTYLADLTAKFRFEPKADIQDTKDKKGISKTFVYTWIKDGKTVSYSYIYTLKRKAWSGSSFLSITDNNYKK